MELTKNWQQIKRFSKITSKNTILVTPRSVKRSVLPWFYSRIIPLFLILIPSCFSYHSSNSIIPSCQHKNKIQRQIFHRLYHFSISPSNQKTSIVIDRCPQQPHFQGYNPRTSTDATTTTIDTTTIIAESLRQKIHAHTYSVDFWKKIRSTKSLLSILLQQPIPPTSPIPPQQYLYDFCKPLRLPLENMKNNSSYNLRRRRHPIDSNPFETSDNHDDDDDTSMDEKIAVSSPEVISSRYFRFSKPQKNDTPLIKSSSSPTSVFVASLDSYKEEGNGEVAETKSKHFKKDSPPRKKRKTAKGTTNNKNNKNEDIDDDEEGNNDKKMSKSEKKKPPSSPKTPPTKQRAVQQQNKGGKSPSSSSSPKASSPSSSAATPKKSKTKTSPKMEPPEGWEDIYSLVEELRSDRTAPVDYAGSEVLPERNHGEQVFRFQVLLCLMLSSQTKDAIVGEAINNLQKYNNTILNIDKVLHMTPEELDKCIYRVGFHNNKVKYIQQTALILKDKYNNDIPKLAADMITDLPGVGPKMAYICESIAWGTQSGIGVDTHMHRIFNLLNWVHPKTKTPEQTRIHIESWLPKSKWSTINLLFVGFGQETQQFKLKILEKAINCTRPKDALKLLKRVGFDYNKEGKKFNLSEQIRDILADKN